MFDQFHDLVLQSAGEKLAITIEVTHYKYTDRFRYIVYFHKSGENKGKFVKLEV